MSVKAFKQEGSPYIEAKLFYMSSCQCIVARYASGQSNWLAGEGALLLLKYLQKIPTSHNFKPCARIFNEIILCYRTSYNLLYPLHCVKSAGNVGNSWQLLIAARGCTVRRSQTYKGVRK